MSGSRRQSKALADASNRANIGILPPVADQKKPAISPTSTATPTFSQLMAATGTNRPASKAPGSSMPAAASVPNSMSKAQKSAAPASKKRKAETTLEEDIATYKQNLDHIISRDAFEDEPMTSCAAVRGRINKLVDSGIMNKTEFAKAIGSNANTLNRFLQHTGQMGGAGSSIYYNAWAWFKQREHAKLKMPNVKKRQKLDVGAATGSSSSSPANGKSTSTTKRLRDISGIHLPGEETDSVPVYETCDDVRRKINAHLKTPGLTQAQFCRDLYAQLHVPKCKGIQSKQLADFRALKGPIAGAKSSVFYAAYVYFEKLRIAQKKPKTAHRETMEDLWAADGGFNREVDHRTSYILASNESATFDQYGRTRIERDGFGLF